LLKVELTIVQRSQVLRGAATVYKVDTEAIATKVRQKFAAKERTKKIPQSTVKAAKKAALHFLQRGAACFG
jgi:hypothetical protein